MGSLNALVSALDEWNLLSRFSEEKHKEEDFRELFPELSCHVPPLA
jgi:hypothetical protein